MFLKKKLIITALIASISFGVFAQTSNTSNATQNLFGNDVDAYMNVNSWSTVAPENFFAYARFSGGTPYLGFAKDFGAFYWGTYFTGNFGNLDNEKTVTGDNTSFDNHSGNNNTANFTFNNLFGFGNIGVKVLFDYYDYGSSKVTTGTTTTTVDVKRIGFGVRVGLSDFELAGKSVLPYAEFFIRTPYSGSKTVVDNGTETTTTGDSRQTYMSIIAGGDIILSDTDALNQTLSTWVRYSSYSYKDGEKEATVNGVQVQQKYLKDSYFYFPVYYTAKFNVTDKLAFAVKPGLYNYIRMQQTAEKVKSTTFTIDPSLTAGLTYDTGKKVILNAGVSIGNLLPTFTMTTETDTTNDPSTKISTTTLNATNGNLSFSSGFAIKPTNNLTIDCSFDIISHLLGTDFTSDLNTGSGYTIWETLNNIFVRDISFQISYKM